MRNLAMTMFLCAAAVGFVLSFVVQCMALAEFLPPSGGQVWSLQVGLMIVFAPAVLLTIRLPRREVPKIVMAGCPPWIRIAHHVTFGYALVNTLIFYLQTKDLPQAQNDEPSSLELRFASGYWMAFYCLAFAIYYSRIHAPHLYRPRLAA